MKTHKFLLTGLQAVIVRESVATILDAGRGRAEALACMPGSELSASEVDESLGLLESLATDFEMQVPDDAFKRDRILLRLTRSDIKATAIVVKTWQRLKRRHLANHPAEVFAIIGDWGEIYEQLTIGDAVMEKLNDVVRRIDEHRSQDVGE